MEIICYCSIILLIIEKMEQSLSFQYQQLTVNEKPFMKHSTSGWDICVLWKDESTTWEKLLDLKDCYPV